MNSDNLNKWLSLLANFGVVLGLILLVYELQQNNQVVQLQHQAIVSNDVNSIIDMVIQDPDLLEIQAKDPAELTPLERDRLFLLGARLLSNFEDRYENMRAGLMPEESLSATQKSIYNRPVLNYGAPLAWDSYKERANPEFRAWFEENVIGK